MIVITGQTATGKTNIALEYAKKYNGEIVNFDSRQIYKYLDIITGKDLPKNSHFQLQEKINDYQIGFYLTESKIWLYDITTPDKYFSSYEYVKLAQNVIKDIKKRGKTPILVGGSYFYLKHLLYDFDFKASPNFPLREKLNKKSLQELQKILIEINPEVFFKMNDSDKKNPRRLIRRIEIGLNQAFKINKKNKPKKSKFKIDIFLGLCFSSKEKLIKTIKDRVNKRLKQKAIEEVENILKMGYQKTDPGLKTIGYRELIYYLEGKIKKEEAIEKWIISEIKYAKRQLTFMKENKDIVWQMV